MKNKKAQRLLLALQLLQLIVFGLNQTTDDRVMVNDSVSGDPLFTVPLFVPDPQLQQLNITSLSLCYEVLGTAGKYFNLITDECISVNAHYHAMNSFLNTIDEIAMQAVDQSNECHRIWVTLPQCTTHIDNIEVNESYEGRGIHIRRHESIVNIVVPNCGGLPLSMWVVCKECSVEDPTLGRDQFQGETITFTVRRHLSFGHRKTHGLIGQFWNIPMSVKPLLRSNIGTHIINFTSAALRESKTLTGIFHPYSWFTQDNCLYVGTAQASSIKINTSFSTSALIEGSYKDYQLDKAFTEDGYIFGQFNEDRCIVKTTVGTTMKTETTTEEATTMGITSSRMTIIIVATTLGVTSVVVMVMVVIILCLSVKVISNRRHDRASNQSSEINQLEESYDDILHQPHCQVQVALTKNVAYFHESRETNKITNHIYDEIYEQVKAVTTEEIKIVETRVTTQTER